MNKKIFVVLIFVLVSFCVFSKGNSSVDLTVSPYSVRSVNFSDFNTKSNYGFSLLAGYRYSFKSNFAVSANAGASLYKYPENKRDYKEVLFFLKAEYCLKNLISSGKLMVNFALGGGAGLSMIGNYKYVNPVFVGEVKALYKVLDSLSVFAGTSSKFSFQSGTSEESKSTSFIIEPVVGASFSF